MPDLRSADKAVTLIRGARVYDRAGDVHRPPVRDVIVEGNRIASVTAPGELADRKDEITEGASRNQPGFQIIEATGMLLISGARQCALSFLRRAGEGPLRGHAFRRLGPAFAAGLLGQAQ